MAIYPVQKYFIYNGELKQNSEFLPSENEGGIYEVFRVVQGIPLFFEDNIQRFFNSAFLSGLKIIFNKMEIHNFLVWLIQKNKVTEGNILLSCKLNLKAFFIPHKYPADIDYKNGVRCGILVAERTNPNAKVFQTRVRLQADQLIAKNNFYEVLLVDQQNRITEGSRSNVFFVRQRKVFTPPANKVLLGITRQKTLLLAQKLGLIVVEEDIFLHYLHTFEAAFITGTSPKLLPMNSVNGYQYDPQNQQVIQLITAYDKLINRYISDRRNQSFYFNKGN